MLRSRNSVRRAERWFLLSGDRPASLWECKATADVGLRPVFYLQSGNFHDYREDHQSTDRQTRSWPGAAVPGASAADVGPPPLCKACQGKSSHRRQCPGLKKEMKCGFRCSRKMKQHLRMFCHCEQKLWGQAKARPATLPIATSSSTLNPEDTAANQLRLFDSFSGEVRSLLCTMPDQLRAEIMTRLQDIRKLAQVFKHTELGRVPLCCPDSISLQMASLISLMSSDPCEVQISALSDGNTICIDNTFGKRLVLKPGLGEAAEHQRLTLEQFQSATWATASQQAAQTEEDWKAELVASFFCEETQGFLSFPEFATTAQSLLDTKSPMFASLGFARKDAVKTEARAVWQRILLQDRWHQRTSRGQGSGFLMCNAQVQLENIHIHGTTQGERALVIADDASVILRGCRVSGRGNGVYLTNKASLEMTSTFVCDCGSSGVVVANTLGTCHMEDCRISGNANVGIVLGGPNVTGESCVIQETASTENKTHGISLFGRASAKWCGSGREACDLLSGNGLSDIKEEDGSCLVLPRDQAIN
ncbi:unnamed protein product [Effrenium voratum]|uniref:Right handed beta helix domain-containing protein n=1 Tax=Effrenium voratum TaxID=2562239 RepID=A0AA36JHF6_9DINO|nr:unnamed protein product [Effrenium voratum]CAJ1451468.1 unnamed protein product [Effrenium voratum]